MSQPLGWRTQLNFDMKPFILSFAHGLGPRDARAGLSQKTLERGGCVSSQSLAKTRGHKKTACLVCSLGGHLSCQQPCRRESWALLHLLWNDTHVLSAVIPGHLTELSSFYITIIVASPTVSAMVSLSPEILNNRLVFLSCRIKKKVWSRLKEK